LPFQPRTLFITGASSGIGAALAQHYAAPGVRLGLLGRRAAALETVAQDCRAAGAEVWCFQADVSDAAAMQRAAADFIATAGLPDAVIASAGVSAGTLSEHAEDLAVIRRLLEINVFGLAASFSPFIAPMRAAGGERRLVGLASVAGIRGLPGAEAYSASKAAAIAYLESLRLELRGSGIRVVTIAPGYIDTPMTRINPYRMPFLLPAATAARRFAAAIARGRSYVVIPWQMGLVAKLLRLLPNWLYDRLFAGAPHKPRGILGD
jgi:NAD(P)-dependent dehydrogenase (short-subunit alcohol dehydrogenase family)